MLKRKRYLPIDSYLEALTIPLELKQKRDQFYQNIRSFYKRKWGFDFKAPSANGQELDLFEMYEAVTFLGGWQKVTALNRWSEVLQLLKIDENIQMAEHAVQFLYMRFLSKFEQSEAGNDISEEHEAELISGRTNRFKTFASLSQANCAEPPFSAPKAVANTSVPDFHKLAFALLSGLPNEVSFGLNILTVLSHPGPFVLNFANCPQLIALLVALCGVCINVEGPSNPFLLYDWWRRSSGYDFASFWADSGIEEAQLLSIVYNPDGMKMNATGSEFERNTAQLMGDDRLDLDRPTNWRVFNVLAIFHNLSFEEVNTAHMGESHALVRFLLLCSNCRWHLLRKIAYDTLSNIAKNIKLVDKLSTVLLSTVQKGLHSNDKCEVMRSMEIVAGLCATPTNESIVCEFFEESQILPRIFALLSLKDILMCMCAMESVLAISELGRVACEAVARCDRAVEMLLCFLTTDALSFGTVGLAGMHVVEVHGHQTRPYVAPNKKNPPPPLKLQPVQPPVQSAQQQHQTPASSTTTTAPPYGEAIEFAINARTDTHETCPDAFHRRATDGNDSAQFASHQRRPPTRKKVYLKSSRLPFLNHRQQSAAEAPPLQNGLSSIAAVVPSSIESVANERDFMCEWLMQSEGDDDWSDEEGTAAGPIEPCARFFTSASQMLFHVYNEHLVPLVQQHSDGEPPRIRCRWPICDNTPRTLWSITTHLQDIHCTENALELAMLQRVEMGYHEYVCHIRQQFERSRERPSVQNAYSDFAAQEAIRRHAFANLRKEITEDSEGPVTRSIRLTSALILRNICHHSVAGRRKLRAHESFISWLSLSRMESARTLAQCLSEMARHANNEMEPQRNGIKRKNSCSSSDLQQNQPSFVSEHMDDNDTA
ncbi:hypothetical protein niasHS_000650 [Heterodera schachtii]|uniref:ARID domain-containing protein n=1 Tax=Heterodera schachtii TaxID=97005 RepID=A0ABD2K597_HETSC